MKPLLGLAARLAAIPVPIVMVCTLTTALRAQPTLKITSPADGTVVSSGQTLVVKVGAAPAAFQRVLVVGDDPIGESQILTSPPYEFQLQIPSDIDSGTYSLTAVGIIRIGSPVYSDPITVDIERPDSPQRLRSALSTLGFDYVGDNITLVVTGFFADGSRVDLTHSTLTKYTSDTPTVATVDDQGLVTGTAPGSAKITIRNGDAIVLVPVTVPNKRSPAK
jgi:hypothetical protein